MGETVRADLNISGSSREPERQLCWGVWQPVRALARQTKDEIESFTRRKQRLTLMMVQG
jgi:hypothetical protein